jgi:hypothetical protein
MRYEEIEGRRADARRDRLSRAVSALETQHG